MSAKVAFIGLGVMGFPMAGHLKAKGYDVTVYNRTGAKADDWVKKHGGKAASTPAVNSRSTSRSSTRACSARRSAVCSTSARPWEARTPWCPRSRAERGSPVTCSTSCSPTTRSPRV